MDRYFVTCVSPISGLRYNQKVIARERANRAPREMPGWGGACLAVSLTGRFSSLLHFDWRFRHWFFVGDLQQLLRLRTEAVELLVISRPRLYLFHPLHRPVEALAGLVFLPELPVRHCQEE